MSRILSKSILALSVWRTRFLTTPSKRSRNSAVKIQLWEYLTSIILPSWRNSIKWNPSGFHTMIIIILLFWTLYLDLSDDFSSRGNQIHSWSMTK
jgi:hypothetical protein